MYLEGFELSFRAFDESGCAIDQIQHVHATVCVVLNRATKGVATGFYELVGMQTGSLFFDTFLFLPYASFISSDYAKSVEGWQFYLDDLYCEDRNMDALNQAVGIVADELGLGDYKCTVFTTIIYPPSELAGDVNAQKEAIKWLMDQEYQRFLEGGYDRLEFGGFYWYREYLATGESSEKELTQFAADYAHSLGFKIFWVPYYCSRGYSSWEEYGFDMSMIPGMSRN